MTLSRKRFGDLVLLSAGKISLSGVIFLGGVILARRGGSAEYAIFSVALSVVLLLDGLLGAPFDTAAVRFAALHPNQDERTARFQAMALHLKILAALLIFLLAGFVFGIARSNSSRWIPSGFPISACALATLALLAARSSSVHLQIRGRFRAYSLLDLLQGGVRLAGFALLVLIGHAKAAPFVYVFALGAFCAAAIILLQNPELLGRWPAVEDSKRMLSYSGYSAAIIALGTVTGKGDLVLLGLGEGTSKVGAYSAAALIASLLALWAMFATVLTQPKLIQLAREGRLRSLFRWNALAVAGLALISAAVLHPLVLETGLKSLFGKDFGEAAPLLRILWVGALIDWATVPILMIYCIQICPGQVLRGESVICACFLLAGAAASFGWLGDSPSMAMAIVATSARLLKLALYGTLFFLKTRDPPDVMAAFTVNGAEVKA